MTSAHISSLIGSHKSSNFAPAFFFLNAERRRALKVLYAVCRTLDDATDKPHPDPRGYLAAWKSAFESRSATSLEAWGQKELAVEFLAIMERYGIPTYAMMDLIDKGVSVDLEPHFFETPLDLESYCYGVAGTVGIACLPIFGVPVEEAKDFAVRLGITVQWINVIRDVGVDAQGGRIYLPLDHLDQFGYTKADLYSLKCSTEFKALINKEIQVARGHFRRAEELLPEKWRKQLLPARIMGNIYLALLDKIERCDYPVLNKKMSLNWWQKGAATWKALKE